MSSHDYQLITQWRVRGTTEEVSAVLADATDLPRWWPAVYLRALRLKAGREEDGVGEEVALHAKGWLPYTLRWDFTVTDVVPRERIAIEARGDFVGYGVWTFRQDGPWVDITYDWRIAAEKPVLRSLSFLLKPVFEANHHWAMRKGLESLELELARRRAPNEAERAQVPAPPSPSSVSPFALIAALAFVLWLARR